jgi:large subunit ribosomal protein L3
MGIGILGKKLGMTQTFTEHGSSIPVTIIQAGPCQIVQKKSVEKEGYNAIQCGFTMVKKIKNVNKPLVGHFKKADLAPLTFVKEFRVNGEELDAREIGGEITVELFEPGDYVDVTGTSKGHGFTGVMKRHGFKGAPASRGSHEVFRHGGSIGQNMTPGRTVRGKKMAGQSGARRVTTQNLKVIDVRGDMNVLVLEGAVPGPANGFLIIRKAVKKS